MSPNFPDNLRIYKDAHPMGEQTPVCGNLFYYPRSGRVSYDMHHRLEIGILRKGRIRRRTQDHFIELQAGDLWFVGSWEIHGYQVLSAPCAGVVMFPWPNMPTATFFPEMPTLRLQAPFLAPPRQRPYKLPALKADLLQFADRFQDLLARKDAFAQVHLHLAICELLARVMEIWRTPALHDQSAPVTSNRIQPALTMIARQQRLVSVSEAARACGMSRNRFAGCFQQLMGMGFSEFSLRHRLGGASKQLRETTAPLKTISREWGFTDESHFRRVFLTYYKMKPADYRRLDATPPTKKG